MKRVLWIVLLLTGCVQTQGGSSALPKYEVKCAGDCLELRKAKATIDPALVRSLEQMLAQQRYASADALIERNLETCIALLRQREGARTPAEMRIAKRVDALLQHPQGDGLNKAEALCDQASKLAQAGQWSKVAELLKAHHNDVAAYPYHAVQAGMLSAEAQRHLGNAKDAIMVWRATATIAAQRLAHLPLPTLFETLAAQRPTTAAWPNEFVTAVTPSLPAGVHEDVKHPQFAIESIVWYSIGKARLRRSEASEALTAFRRAEGRGTFANWDAFLALHQAKALLAMEQTPVATSILTGLVSAPPTSPWRAPALALLGSGKLQDGHTQQAVSFLREAISSGNADTLWRADAEANLALVCLLTRDEANGLRLLSAAEERFTAQRDTVALFQCLENTAAYLEQAGKADDAQRIRQHIREMESRSH